MAETNQVLNALASFKLEISEQLQQIRGEVSKVHEEVGTIKSELGIIKSEMGIITESIVKENLIREYGINYAHSFCCNNLEG